MTLAEQFNLAIEYMLLGMGVVFVFLALLVFVVQWMGQLIQKIEAARTQSTVVPRVGSGGEAVIRDDTLTAVITAAVHQYRADHS